MNSILIIIKIEMKLVKMKLIKKKKKTFLLQLDIIKI